MDKNFCQQIDRELLVEQYVCGRLKGDLLEKFENHIQGCEVHAQAVTLEKAIKRGVSEFARSEIKSKLHDRLKKREDTRFLLLRYAAVLFVAVITPLLLYYQFNIGPTRTVKMETPKPAPSTIREKEKPAVKAPGPVATVVNEKKEPLLPKQTSDKRSSRGISRRKTGYGSSGGGTRDTETLQGPKTAPPEPEMDVKIADESSQELDTDYSEQEEIKGVQGFNAVSSAKDLVLKKDVQSIMMLEFDKKVEKEYSTIELCIKTHLKENERPGYQIRLSIQIAPSGDVGEIKVLEANIRSSELEVCMINIIKNWTFSPGIEDTTIEKTIIYKQS